MITASEPLEFIPRGREAVEEHPGPLVPKKLNLLHDYALLHRLQNVNISNESANVNEFWKINEIYKDVHLNKKKSATNSRSESPNFLNEYYVNTEEELYFKGNTAVWSKGLENEYQSEERICLTCETPIRSAFFCSTSFIDSRTPDEKNSKPQHIGVCLLDRNCLKVYRNDGENFVTTIETPISNIWSTKYCILFEKESSQTIIAAETIPMPRVFSLTHPLDEMCPVLIKTNTVKYLTESDYKIIFTSEENDLIFMFDNSVGKHFVCRLRKAEPEETKSVSAIESNNSSINASGNLNTPYANSQNSMKLSFLAKHNASLQKTNITGNSPQSEKSQPAGSFSLNASRPTTPLSRLQSNIGQSRMMMDVRKLGKSEQAKPIVPEFCLEQIWTDNSSGWKEFHECATSAFFHTDLIGQSYLCYLLPRSFILSLARLEKSNPTGKQIFGMVSNIQAKDAIPLKRMNMLAILAPCGTLMLYTGPCLVGKVHVAGILTSLVSSSNFSLSFNSTFPRRSSLLPTISSSTDSKFDDDLHLLSPVPPLHPQHPGKLTNCEKIRDPAGNRITLVFNGGRMFRISLPWICKSTLVSKCLLLLKQVLPKDVAINFFIKWYGVRNVPGSHNYSPQQEWEIFQRVLFESLGRSTVDKIDDDSQNSSLFNKSQSPKKRRKSENNHGTDADWEYLLANERLSHKGKESTINEPCAYSPDTLLFNFIPLLMYSFHLLYEDLKLDITIQDELSLLADFLYQMALELKLENYRLHYFLDFPQLINYKTNNFINAKDSEKLQNTHLLKTDNLPNIFQYIKQILHEPQELTEAYPYIKCVNKMSKNIIQLIYLIMNQHKSEFNDCIKKIAIPGVVSSVIKKNKCNNSKNTSSRAEEIIHRMIRKDITRCVMEKLPVSIHMILSQALEKWRTRPPIGCDPKVYELLLRPDLVAHAIFPKVEEQYENISQYSPQKDNSLSSRVPTQPDVIPKSDKAIEENGMENIDTKLLRLRFADDLRINDVQHFLNSSQPVTIDIVQSPNVSDHEFIEEQEKQLYALSTRTMALPLGRGMFTLRTNSPTSTESLFIPKLCLSGKELERGATIELQQIEVPPNMNLWPLFHNGVASGLRITTESKDIDSTWITYNKPKGTGTQEIPTEHAGFLMALGLNRHLACLSFMSVYDYLVKCDEMTSVGLLLGISCTYLGTMDMNTTRLLSVHMEALLPPTAVELDIPQNIQVASLMGLGLLYQGTSKRHIAEVLLQEIGRPPGPEMENYVERESYALTAGLALGLVTLGQGDLSTGLKDLTLPDTLHYYMIGGNKRPLTGAQKEKYKLPSFQIREGETVNIDVTAPGATLALGLMFFQTNNEAVANWMKPPDTKYFLDFIRPDLLLLRVIARGLIQWDSIEPSTEWVYAQVPQHLSEIIKQRPDIEEDGDAEDIDHESNCQAYCNIITGAAFCIGLRYAGTENPVAYHTLKKIINLFLNITGHYISEFAGKATVESCVIMVLLSISLVFAGTGDLGILRIIRMMRSRIGYTNNHVTYGSHMAIHMALGFLFLGAGRFSLSRTPLAVASLVCSLFPKFPTHSNDNRYHLQAFRHLYVLAIEPRLFLPRDIDSGKLCLCNLYYTKIGSTETFTLMAPCLLPELDTLDRVFVDDDNYWPIYFEKKINWKQLLNILNMNGCIDIKKRAGCLSHLDDPHRLKSMFGQTLTTEQFNSWKIDLKSLLSFSNDEVILCLIRKYLKSNADRGVIVEGAGDMTEENNLIQSLILQVNNCLTRDKMHALPIYVSLLMHLRNLNKSSNSFEIWQVKLITTVLRKYINEDNNQLLFSLELLQSLISKFSTKIEIMLADNLHILMQYVFSNNLNNLLEFTQEQLKLLSSLIVFYNLPSNLTNNRDLKLNYLQIISELKKLNLNMETETMNCIVNIFSNK